MFDKITSIITSILPADSILKNLPMILSIVNVALGNSKVLTPEAAQTIQVEIEKLRHGKV